MYRKSYFKDKVIILTGASSGIGLASAELFGRLGARLVLAARRASLLEEIAARIRQESAAEVLCVPTDVTVEEQCRNLVEKTLEHFGRIDILVNNAGLSMRAMFRDVDLDVLRRLMDVNFWGTVYCTKYALPALLESKGTVAGIISIAGYSALPARTGYSSSKYAVRGFLDSLRIEHMKDGLNVLAFAPNYVASDVRKSALVADGSSQGETPLHEDGLMSAETCAKHLARALSHRRSRVTLTFLGKLTAAGRQIIPQLDDIITYRYISREKNSPFK